MPRSPNALELLRKDHRNVLTLLRKFEKSGDEREQHDLCGEIIAELDAHTALEEDCFYPFVREASDRFDLIEEATIEHVLRFDFPGYDRELQRISWDAWLRTFNERELVFLYQERMKAGNQSNFFRLDSPHREDG